MLQAHETVATTLPAKLWKTLCRPSATPCRAGCPAQSSRPPAGPASAPGALCPALPQAARSVPCARDRHPSVRSADLAMFAPQRTDRPVRRSQRGPLARDRAPAGPCPRPRRPARSPSALPRTGDRRSSLRGGSPAMPPRSNSSAQRSSRRSTQRAGSPKGPLTSMGSSSWRTRGLSHRWVGASCGLQRAPAGGRVHASPCRTGCAPSPAAAPARNTRSSQLCALASARARRRRRS